MSNDLFTTIFSRILGHEGGYVNNPNDPGGETNWGISKRSYPDVDIKNLTREAALEIYKKDFWAPFASGIAYKSIVYQLADFAVNSGSTTAIRYYQRALGVADDGHFGPRSKEAAAAISESDQLMLLLAERLEFMTKLKNWDNASKGWARRIATNLRYAATDTED